MTTQIYFVDDDWCFLNVSVKENKTYWIDWEKCRFPSMDQFAKMRDKKVLCVMEDNEYGYYDTNNSTCHSLENKHLSLCVDNIKCLSNLFDVLNEKYENSFVYLIF